MSKGDNTPAVQDGYTPPTDLEIEEWTKKHGELYRIEVASDTVKYDPYMVPADEEELMQGAVVGYIKTPTDKTLSYAFSKMPQMLEAGKVILKNSWIGGDPRIITEQEFLIPGALQCIEFLQIKQSRLKKHSTTGAK